MSLENPKKRSAKLSMGPDTLEVPVELFALNRQRLVERLRAQGASNRSVIVLQGGDDTSLYDTDVNFLFKQESYFMWAFGVLEPGFYGAISVGTGETYLFMPRLPPSYEVWMGPLWTPEEYGEKYGIDNVFYVDEIATTLSSLNPDFLLTMYGVNSDSGLSPPDVNFDGIEDFQINKDILYNNIAECRVQKTDLEMTVMRYVVQRSSEAHRLVMRMAKPGLFEYQCESEFLHYTYQTGGCRFVSYTCICGAGTNSAILHYGHAAAPNNKLIEDGNMCLFDMGANYFGYAADITCSFPANGKFTPDQKLVYEAVLKANLAVHAAAAPGVSWLSMHLLANRTLLEELKSGGLLQGDLDAMVAAGLGAIFQPHGLGHLLGLDVHDVGGYLPGQTKRPTSPPGASRLRLGRSLIPGMCLTIEPGCYFIDRLLDEALENPQQNVYLVPEVLERFRGFGGVRIEDNVLITENGVENLTNVPRTVEEIEAWMAGKDDGKY